MEVVARQTLQGEPLIQLATWRIVVNPNNYYDRLDD